VVCALVQVELQARVAELDLVYLDSVLRNWPCRRHLLLSYELALAQPSATAAMIAALLDGDAHLAATLENALAHTLRSHEAMGAKMKANPDVAAKIMAEEMATGRSKEGTKIFHKRNTQPSGVGMDSSPEKRRGGSSEKRSSSDPREIAGRSGGSVGDSPRSSRRALASHVPHSAGPMSGTQTNHTVHRRRRLGASRGAKSAAGGGGGAGVVPARDGVEPESPSAGTKTRRPPRGPGKSEQDGGGASSAGTAPEEDPKSHRYYPLFEMKWCRQRRETVASTPTACVAAMRAFLDGFFLPRLPLFQALAGASPY
jgi:hypothetical protein